MWSYIVPGHCTLKYFVCRTICFIVNYPPDTLLQSKLTLGHFNSKQTVPSQGENLLQEKSVSFKVKCPRWTVCSEVKCLGDSLLRSNSPLGHFTSGVKLSCEWYGNMTTSSQEAHTTIPYWRPGPSLVLRPSHHPVLIACRPGPFYHVNDACLPRGRDPRVTKQARDLTLSFCPKRCSFKHLHTAPVWEWEMGAQNVFFWSVVKLCLFTQPSILTARKSPQYRPECPVKEYSVQKCLPLSNKPPQCLTADLVLYCPSLTIVPRTTITILS